MAQQWARPLYHSGAWIRNSKNYLNAVVDTTGELLMLQDDRYVRRSDGSPVPDSMVVPPGMCERCFSMGDLVPATLVHHKRHLTPENVDDPKVSLAYENMQRLCTQCHAEVHAGTSAPRVTFDEAGNVIPRREDLRSMVVRLTETVDERRNVHSSRGAR